MSAQTSRTKEEGKPDKFVDISDEEQAITQSGHDIMYQEEIRLYLDRKQQFQKNVMRACEYIMSHCNAVMRARIEEIPDYKECPGYTKFLTPSNAWATKNS